VSKAGGNALHGSAFEYMRNNFFDARDTFADGPTDARSRAARTQGSLFRAVRRHFTRTNLARR